MGNLAANSTNRISHASSVTVGCPVGNEGSKSWSVNVSAVRAACNCHTSEDMMKGLADHLPVGGSQEQHSVLVRLD